MVELDTASQCVFFFHQEALACMTSAFYHMFKNIHSHWKHLKSGNTLSLQENIIAFQRVQRFQLTIRTYMFNNIQIRNHAHDSYKL